MKKRTQKVRDEPTTKDVGLKKKSGKPPNTIKHLPVMVV